MLRRRLTSPLALSAALTLGSGLAAALALFVFVGHLEFENQAIAFQQRANLRVAAVHAGLNDAVDVLTTTNQLFYTVQPVTRAQFRDFTAPLLTRFPFIQAFSYHRLVEQRERRAIEAELSTQIPGTVLRELRGAALVDAAARARYSVVDYIEPLLGNERALGLDVSTNPVVAEALDQAVMTGLPTATRLLTLNLHNRPQPAFEVLLPVYRAGMPLFTVEQRHAALAGDTAAVVRADELVEKILTASALASDHSVSLSVYASDQPDASLLVYDDGRAAPEPAQHGTLAHWLDTEFRNRQTSLLDIAGRRWRVEVVAAPRPFLHDHLSSLSTLVGGLLLTLIMTAFVNLTVRRSRRVQDLVAARTADLQESERRFRQLVTMSSDWYWEQDREFRFTSVTGGIREKGGLEVDRLLGKTRWDIVPGMEHTEWGRQHIATLQAHEPFADLEYTVVDEHGSARWYNVNGQPVFDEQGGFAGYRGTGTDITARKLTEQRIHHVAQHDVLTGLPNRSLLQDRLQQAVAYSARTGRAVWVMLIDLDRFKFVNDSMGHKAGDVLLMTVAARLRGALRDTDTVARLSGDEFVVILAEHDEEKLSADIVQRLMDSVAQPVMLGLKEFFVTCSIGVAVFPTDGAPADSLIEHADIAMYRAKKLGRNNFQFYTPAMNEEALERVHIESALRNALERAEFVLHYQPQVDLASGRVVGMEALLRWQHPEMGMVAPARFIGVAEETGLIVQIGAWVMRTACAQAKHWQDAGLGRLRVAVNLSARQFSSSSLVHDIRSVLDETGLPADCLEIELTESLFLSDVDPAVELLHAMKGLGINLSIDDFGTGYSSLSYLSRFPIDVLKIDRSFVSDIARDASDAAIVASIIALAHNLKLSVIAEGVETADQLRYLRRHGCDEMQGYYFSKPLAPADFEQLLRQRRVLAMEDAELASAAA